MPTDTTDATLAPPADAGLPTGRSRTEPGGPSARSGDELIAAATRGESLSHEESEDLLEYFVANGELPGDDEPVPVEWEIGEGRARRKQVWLVKRIGWDAWKESEARSTDEKTGVVDGLQLSSWIVAHALVRPQLGPRVRKMQESDPKRAPEHAADLLQRMFRKQAGTLAAIAAEVRRISRLGTDQNSARTLDEEVAAGEA
jgi:hypothetical protein